MRDKRTIIFPSLLFATLFCLITITGFLQINVTYNNIEELLRSEGEIFFKHIKREIDTNLEYLSLLEKSPFIVTPTFLNIMIYDEAIVDDLYSLVTATPQAGLAKLPFQNILVIDREGRTIWKRGTLKVPEQTIGNLLSKKQETFVRMPTNQHHTLLIGVSSGSRIIFFSLTGEELDALRTKYIIEEIIEQNDKRFNIGGIRIYGPDRKPYINLDPAEKDAFTLTKPLNSKLLPGFTMEILVSKELARNISKRTAVSLMLILTLLLVSGALSIYAIFFIERKHADKVAEMEKELALQERLVSLGKLASGMAHEIRNPLNAISLSIQRLKREFVPAEDRKDEYYQFVDIMRGEVTRVDRIVEEFLLSTKAQVPMKEENLHDVMDEVMLILREKAESRQVQMTNRMDRNMKSPVQKDRLKQAFCNIILNGIEAVGQNGAIEVSGETKNKFVEIAVKDTGTGIKKDQIPAIFDYYYTTKDKGMGLGLPISYMIIKDHNGEIRVASEEGKGTTFFITLPLIQPADQKHNPQNERPRP